MMKMDRGIAKSKTQLSEPAKLHIIPPWAWDKIAKVSSRHLNCGGMVTAPPRLLLEPSLTPGSKNSVRCACVCVSRRGSFVYRMLLPYEGRDNW